MRHSNTTIVAVLATAAFAFAAPLETPPCDHNITSSSNIPLATRGIWADIFGSGPSGTVNWYFRSDCQNKCVEGMYCGAGSNKLRGDAGDIPWNQDSGKGCFERPTGAHSVGVVATEGHHVGITIFCNAYDDGVHYDEKPIVSKNGDDIDEQGCTAGGQLTDDIKAVVWRKG